MQEKRVERVEQNGAATKLQGLQRQKQAKAEVEAKRTEKVEQNGAATKLQGLQRQKQAKAVVEEKRIEKVEQNGAATKLQGLQRQKQAKAAVQEKRVERAEQNNAATKLQGLQRQKTAKAQVEEQRKIVKATDPLILEIDIRVQGRPISLTFTFNAALESMRVTGLEPELVHEHEVMISQDDLFCSLSLAEQLDQDSAEPLSAKSTKELAALCLGSCGKLVFDSEGCLAFDRDAAPAEEPAMEPIEPVDPASQALSRAVEEYEPAVEPVVEHFLDPTEFAESTDQPVEPAQESETKVLLSSCAMRLSGKSMLVSFWSEVGSDDVKIISLDTASPGEASELSLKAGDYSNLVYRPPDGGDPRLFPGRGGLSKTHNKALCREIRKCLRMDANNALVFEVLPPRTPNKFRFLLQNLIPSLHHRTDRRPHTRRPNRPHCRAQLSRAECGSMAAGYFYVSTRSSSPRPFESR